MFAIIALPSALASLDTEKDSGPFRRGVPANTLTRGVDALATKVKTIHRASKAHTEPAVEIIQLSVEESMIHDQRRGKTSLVQDSTEATATATTATPNSQPPQHEGTEMLVRGALRQSAEEFMQDTA